jgi:hypothetical protein
MNNSFKDKYLKYKLKYNNLKFQIAGYKHRISGDENYESNPSLAAEFYQKAIDEDENDLESYFKLGKMYENGIGVNTNIYKAQCLYKKAGIEGHTQSLDSFREYIFNIFVNELFTFEELNDKNEVYFLIGTYPSRYEHLKLKIGDIYNMITQNIEYELIINNILIEHRKKLIRDKLEREKNNIENFKYYSDEPLSQDELQISNRIYYFIDNYYTKSYMNLLKLYLTTSGLYFDLLNTPFHLPIKFYEGKNYLKIHFTRLNIVLYIIRMFLPSQYSFDNHLTKIDTNFHNQMSYTKKCILSNTWNAIYCNILNFLNKSSNKFYLLNDAMFFYNGGNQAENRYFEFFCEFGYILNELYKKNKGNNVLVVIPNNRFKEFIDGNIVPKFERLSNIYLHNFG